MTKLETAFFLYVDISKPQAMYFSQGKQGIHG